MIVPARARRCSGDPVAFGLLAQAGPEQEIAGAEGVPLALEHRRHPALQGLQVGRVFFQHGLRRPVGLAGADLDRGRGGGDRHDVLDRNEAREPLAELGHDGLAILLGEAVLLVQGHDQPLAPPRQFEHGLAIGPGQVLVDDEHQQVGAGGQVDRLGLAGPALGPASPSPGVSVSSSVPSTPSTTWVCTRPPRVVPIVAPVSPTERPSIALISEVLPTGPVPITTTWNSGSPHDPHFRP